MTTVSAFFGSISTWLTILKYLGLCLAAGSSVWATVNVLTTPSADGRKQLTRAGVVSIVLTAVGLVISLAAEDLQRRRTAATQAAQVTAEARRTNEIILAGQPLTSLAFQWRFATESPELRETMQRGEAEILENAESSQGGVPAVPFEIMEYNAALLPLLSYIARAGSVSSDDEEFERNGRDRPRAAGHPVVVLMPLDESPNAILSFGEIGTGVQWHRKRPNSAAPAGFAALDNTARTGNSTPHVRAELKPGKNGASTYTVAWTLDPVTLANAIDRVNTAIAPTARLPRRFKIALLSEVVDLPFEQNSFGQSFAVNLWDDSEWQRRDIVVGDAFTGMTLTVEANGVADARRSYAFKTMYRRDLVDDTEDEFAVACTILEFE